MPRKRKTAPGTQTSKKPIQEIERIVAFETRPSPAKGGELVQMYRLRWKGYGSADDSWRTREELTECGELLAEFEEGRARAAELGIIGLEEGVGMPRRRRGAPPPPGARGHRKTKSVSFCETVVRKQINAAGDFVEVREFLRE